MAKITAAKWPSTGRIGEMVRLEASLEGIKESKTVSFDVVEYSGSKGDRPVDTLTKTVSKGSTSVSIMYQVKHVEEATRTSGFPEFRFAARIGSASRTSNVLGIGKPEKPRWEKDPFSTAPDPPPNSEAVFLFGLSDTLRLTIPGTGMKNYVWDFTVFLRERGSNNQVLHTPVGTVTGVAAQSDTLVEAFFSFANLDKSKYIGKKFDFTVDFRLPGAPPKTFSSPGPIISDVIQAAPAYIELGIPFSEIPVVSPGQQIVYPFRVRGAGPDFPLSVFVEIDSQLLSIGQTVDPEDVNSDNALVEVTLDIADNLVRQNTSFKVSINDLGSGQTIDEVIAPLYINGSGLILDCSGLNSDFIIDDLDARRTATVSVPVSATPMTKVTVAVSGLGLGIMTDQPEMTKTASDTFIPFDFTFTTDAPVPLGQFVAVFNASGDKGDQDNCELEFNVVQRLKVNVPAGIQQLDYDTDAFLSFSVERLRRVFENEKYVFFPDLFDLSGNRVDPRSLFRTYPSLAEVTFKTNFDATAFGQLRLKPKTSAEIAPFRGRIQLVANRPDFVIYDAPDPFIDIQIP